MKKLLGLLDFRLGLKLFFNKADIFTEGALIAEGYRCQNFGQAPQDSQQITYFVLLIVIGYLLLCISLEIL